MGKDFRILQIDINGNKISELTNLIITTKPKIVTIQETKLNPKLKTPEIPDLAIRLDSVWI